VHRSLDELRFERLDIFWIKLGECAGPLVSIQVEFLAGQSAIE
jgi:hypothetical protein